MDKEAVDRAKTCFHVGISVADAQELSGFLLDNFEPQGSSRFSSYPLGSDHGQAFTSIVEIYWWPCVAPEAQPATLGPDCYTR